MHHVHEQARYAAQPSVDSHEAASLGASVPELLAGSSNAAAVYRPIYGLIFRPLRC